MKKMNKKGFTLAELLIVVAIIAVLVAIAIPVFTAQLEKSKEATDLANVRAAYAELVSNYLTDGTKDSTTYTLKSNPADCKTDKSEQVAGVGVEYILTADGGKVTIAVESDGSVKIANQPATTSLLSSSADDEGDEG